MKYDVCVFGGCSIDQTFYQNPDGSYSDKPNEVAPGGKGANQAVAAARAGANTTIITKVGKDSIGRKIITNFQMNGVDISNIEMVDGLQNDYANIKVNIKDKDNDIERFSGAIDSLTPDMIDKYSDVLLNSKIIVCQLKCPKETTESLINFCHKNNKILVLTPCRPEKLSVSDKSNLKLIDKIGIITCNKKECETIFGTDNIEECVTKYPNKLIVTLGVDGLMYHNGTDIVNLKSIDVDVIDTTGAGDTLNGNLSAFLSKGLDLRHAVRKAMYASTMKITKKTAQAGMPYKEDLENFISNTRHKNFNYNKELQLALKIVKKAYGSIKYGSKFKVYSKSDNSLVTDADYAIENFLINKIKEKYPDDNFVTEENFPDGELKDRTWVIDPIDGTKHFIKKDGMWGIQLAFYDKGSTKFSTIYIPDKKEMYHAVENEGAFLNNNKIFKKKNVNPIGESIVEFSGSIYKNLDKKKIYFENLMEDDHLKVSDVLYINACSIAYTNLVSGKTDALISSVTRPWDVMPGELLCRESGIKSMYLDFDQDMMLVTNNSDIRNTVFGIYNNNEKESVKSK